MTSKTDSIDLAHQDTTHLSDSTSCTILYCKEGIASFYGRQFQGRFTSNGERFDRYKYTAAHKTLPFGTLVIVTNLANNKSVVVRINDRMPIWNKCEIDLSQIAANDLGFVLNGTAKVQLEILQSKN